MAAHSFIDPPTLTNQVGPDDACAATTEFLLDRVGNHLMAGEPHMMVSALRAVWIVPVQLAYLHSGTLGSVGVVAVDEETGQIVAWTPLGEMKIAARRLRTLHEPGLSEQFHTAIASSPSTLDE
jgi:hypothetical protein